MTAAVQRLEGGGGMHDVFGARPQKSQITATAAGSGERPYFQRFSKAVRLARRTSSAGTPS